MENQLALQENDRKNKVREAVQREHAAWLEKIQN